MYGPLPATDSANALARDVEAAAAKSKTNTKDEAPDRPN
jgi:hypothetical protein